MLLPADPHANYRAHKAEIDAAVLRVLEKGWYILGAEVSAFEKEFGSWLGASCSAVGVGHGTDALTLALKALNVAPGERVATVSQTAVATVSAIELCGAMPVLLDVDMERFTLDPSAFEALIKQDAASGKKIKALIVVHLYGHMAEMKPLLELAQHHGVSVIEDCAQAHGALWNGHKAGTLGDAAAFSFYPTKNLGALGDGGAVAARQPKLIDKIKILREYGWAERYISHVPGMNSRLDELQAAILRIKLKYLDEENAKRREIAAYYTKELAGTPLEMPRVIQKTGEKIEHVYHQFVVRVPNGKRDALQTHLKAKGILTPVHYPQAVHTQPAYRGRVELGPGGLPHTEILVPEILSLPMHAQLTAPQLERVVQAAREFFK